MDPQIDAAARALAAGDPLAALKRVALRDDAAGLALRGIALAQLGELERARGLLRTAARQFGTKRALARARCLAAEAEISLALRDLRRSDSALAWTLRTFIAHGDRSNALYTKIVMVRRAILLGRVDEAERELDALDLANAPAMLVAVAELARASVASRKVRAKQAKLALERARAAARTLRIAPLTAEVERAWQELESPAALLMAAGEVRSLSLAEVEQLFDSDDLGLLPGRVDPSTAQGFGAGARASTEPKNKRAAGQYASGATLVLDACRRRLRCQQVHIELARRPVLFALARELAEAWPADASRARLIASAFGARRIDDSHRVRLRVELGRLRRELRSIASIHATRHGFVLTPKRAQRVAVLAPPSPDHDTALLALLADGERWSTSALALALGASQRTVQRALAALELAGKVSSFGRGRLCRWLGSPVRGFATSLLLPAGLPLVPEP